MNAGTRLALYGAGLAVAFGGAYVAADAFVPDRLVTEWTLQSESNQHGEGHR